MMLSILCALFALIVLMSCAAVRAARAMRSGPGTEAQATRHVAGGGWWVEGEAEGPQPAGSALLLYSSTFTSLARRAWWVVGDEHASRSSADSARRPNAISRGPPGWAQRRVP